MQMFKNIFPALTVTFNFFFFFWQNIFGINTVQCLTLHCEHLTQTVDYGICRILKRSAADSCLFLLLALAHPGFSAPLGSLTYFIKLLILQELFSPPFLTI